MKTKGRLVVACALALACKTTPSRDAGRRGPPSGPDVVAPPNGQTPAMLADPYADAAAAVRAAMGSAGAAALPPVTALDLDADGTLEALYRDDARGCYLAVRRDGAWRARALAVEVGNNDDDVRCLDPVRVGARVYLAATGGGMVRDTETSAVSSSSVGVTLWSLVGTELTAVWSDEVADAQNDDGYRVAPLGEAGLVVTRKEHGATVQRALAVAASGAITARSCWAAVAPEALPEPPAGCTARPGRLVSLAPTEGAAGGVRVDLGPAGSLAILHAGAAARNGARAYCAVAPEGGATGYAVLRPPQLRGCPAFP